jgi:hypothetical protein
MRRGSRLAVLALALELAGARQAHARGMCGLIVRNPEAGALRVQFCDRRGAERWIPSPPGGSERLDVEPGNYKVILYRRDGTAVRESQWFRLASDGITQEFICASGSSPICDLQIKPKARPNPDEGIEACFSTPMFTATLAESFYLEEAAGGERMPLELRWAEDRRSVMLIPHSCLLPDTEYRIGCSDLNGISCYGEPLAELRQVAFTTGHLSRRIPGVSGFHVQWSGSQASLRWDAVPGADGYLVSWQGQKEPRVVEESRTILKFADDDEGLSFAFQIAPYRLVDGKRVVSENKRDIEIVDPAAKARRMKGTFPIGGLRLGAGFPMELPCALGDTFGCEAGFDCPLWSEWAHLYAALGWAGADSASLAPSDPQEATAAMGLRVSLPWRNHLFRLEPSAGLGYFIGYGAAPESFGEALGRPSAWSQGPEARLGLRLDCREIGIFADIRTRIEGLYEGAPRLETTLLWGIGWSFIGRYW